MNNTQWQIKHRQVMVNFLNFLYNRTDRFIFKGGSALAICYGLDRFSEDLDFDTTNAKLNSHVIQFCKYNHYSFRETKNTHYGQRFFINYGNNSHPLKVETSTRKKNIPNNLITVINNYTIYDLDNIAFGKLNAYQQRDKLRDLYDVVYIVNNYFDKLSLNIQYYFIDAFQYKGLEQFDYLTKNKDVKADILIDENKLMDNLLKAYDKLGLLYNNNEKVNNITHAQSHFFVKDIYITDISLHLKGAEDDPERDDWIKLELKNNSSPCQEFYKLFDSGYLVFDSSLNDSDILKLLNEIKKSTQIKHNDKSEFFEKEFKKLKNSEYYKNIPPILTTSTDNTNDEMSDIDDEITLQEESDKNNDFGLN
jgi:predicted nucleotidyltransferase component of viral defense system